MVVTKKDSWLLLLLILNCQRSRQIPTVHVHLSLIFVILVIISYDNIVLTKVRAQIWEHKNIATMRANGARSTSSQTFRQFVKTTTIKAYYLKLWSPIRRSRDSLVIIVFIIVPLSLSPLNYSHQTRAFFPPLDSSQPANKCNDEGHRWIWLCFEELQAKKVGFYTLTTGTTESEHKFMLLIILNSVCTQLWKVQ